MANFNFNKSFLGGRLTATPELKTNPSGVPVTTFSIAINRKSKGKEKSVDFINCVAWRSTAELICRFFRKGSTICVVGSIQTRTWKTKNDENRYATDVVVDEVFFVDSKSEIESGSVTEAIAEAAPQEFAVPQFEEVEFTGDDVPF